MQVPATSREMDGLGMSLTIIRDLMDSAENHQVEAMSLEMFAILNGVDTFLGLDTDDQIALERAYLEASEGVLTEVAI